MRYNNTQIKVDKNGKRYYRPTIVPNIPLKDSDIFIQPVYGTRFDILAQQYYNNSDLWWIIAKANNHSNGNVGPDLEKKLRIPTEIDDILDSLYNTGG